MDDLDEPFGGLGVWIAAPSGRVDDMVPDVFFNHFRDEPIERTSTGHDLLQNRRTIGFTLYSTFNRFQLSADASDSRQELLLFRLGVCHHLILSPWGVNTCRRREYTMAVFAAHDSLSTSSGYRPYPQGEDSPGRGGNRCSRICRDRAFADKGFDEPTSD